jgi:hypothetical protein
VNISLGDVTLAAERYETYDEVTAAYRRREAERGRMVPDHEFVFLLELVAGYVLEKVADRAIAWWRQRRADPAAAPADDIARLEERITALERQLDAAQDAAQAAADVLGAMTRAGVSVSIGLETGTERDLEAELRRRIPESVSVVVLDA